MKEVIRRSSGRSRKPLFRSRKLEENTQEHNTGVSRSAKRSEKGYCQVKEVVGPVNARIKDRADPDVKRCTFSSEHIGDLDTLVLKKQDISPMRKSGGKYSDIGLNANSETNSFGEKSVMLEEDSLQAQESIISGKKSGENLKIASTCIKKNTCCSFFGVQVYADNSRIHGIGVFAGEQIKPGTRIIEYVGEVIGKKMADKRERFYKENNITSIYLFKISDDLIIDATLKGNLARFLNHSCHPNAVSRILNGRIFIYSIHEIGKGEEITFYYNFSSDENDDSLPCYCGHKLCESFIV